METPELGRLGRLDLLRQEAVPAPLDGDVPAGVAQTFMQLKGSDLCLDFVCACGMQGHVDAMFCHVLRCSACGRRYEVAPWLCLRLVRDGEDTGRQDIVVEQDEDPEPRPG